MTGRDDTQDEKGELAFIAYVLFWCLTALPLLAIYALGNGMFGRSIWFVPVDVAKGAAALDPLALIIVFISFPILALPIAVMRRLLLS